MGATCLWNWHTSELLKMHNLFTMMILNRLLWGWLDSNNLLFDLMMLRFIIVLAMSFDCMGFKMRLQLSNMWMDLEMCWQWAGVQQAMLGQRVNITRFLMLLLTVQMVEFVHVILVIVLGPMLPWHSIWGNRADPVENIAIVFHHHDIIVCSNNIVDIFCKVFYIIEVLETITSQKSRMGVADISFDWLNFVFVRVMVTESDSCGGMHASRTNTGPLDE